MAMPHAVRVLLGAYGFGGTVLLLGALSLHGIVGAALFQPVGWHLRSANGADESVALLPHAGRRKERAVQKRTVTPPLRFGKQLMRSLNLRLLCDPTFCNVIVGLALVYSASANFSMILPFFLQVSAGKTSDANRV